MARVRSGLEVLLGERSDLIRGRRFGLLANQASVDGDLRHAIDLLHARDDCTLVALFGPEHGLRGEAQDMEAVDGGLDPITGIPVHSLYGASPATLRPSPDALQDLDVIVCDLQDVGARYYTYTATVLHVLEAAAEVSVPVVILDRPNPLGGEILEGPGLAPGFESFVGRFHVPVRHGLTLGELVAMALDRSGIDTPVEIVTMDGWRRSMTGAETGLPWVLPSPNMPTLDTARVYPGGCLVEGTRLSEGRGTTRPFELIGAPWIDAAALAATLDGQGHPGARFRPHWFRPVAQKWRHATCAGVQVHVTDPSVFRSFATYVALLTAIRDQSPESFEWRAEAYEFESGRLAIDLLAGSDRLRRDIESGRPLAEMAAEWQESCEAFRAERLRYLLYE